MSRTRTADDEDRYEELHIATDEIVIYDVENRRAWIQSDRAYDRDEMA